MIETHTPAYVKCPICDTRHPYFSPKQLAEMFDVTERTIRKKMELVDTIKFGRSRRVPDCKISELIEVKLKDPYAKYT